MVCHNLNETADMLTSVSIYRSAYLDSAVGKWIGSTATETFTFTYHVGF